MEFHKYPIIDFSNGIRIVSGNETLYKEIIHTFLLQYMDYPEKIREKVEEDNIGDAKFYMHNLKGTSAHLGITKICMIVTTMYKEKDIEKWRDLLLSIDHAFLEFKEEAEKYLNGGSGGI